MCPPLGTIIFTLCFFEFLKRIPVLLLFIHFTITIFSIAGLLLIDDFLNFGIMTLMIIGQFCGVALVSLLMEKEIAPVYYEKMIIF